MTTRIDWRINGQHFRKTLNCNNGRDRYFIDGKLTSRQAFVAGFETAKAIERDNAPLPGGELEVESL